MKSGPIVTKTVNFQISETKEIVRENQKYGIIKGYASTYDNVDRTGDVILQGAFTKSLERYKETNSPINMFFQHSPTNMIGGFPIDKVKDDAEGLFVVGEINLDVQKGREAYALAKQGVLSDLSIGFTINDADTSEDNTIRIIKEAELWEASLVAVPANPKAVVTDVKAVTPYKDLPLAPRDRAWGARQAEARVRKFTNSIDAPSRRYREAFMWYDSANADKFGSYKLQYADVIDGSLKAVPRAIFAIAAVLRGARGGVDIPEVDKTRVASHVNKYYKKMGLDSPLKSAEISEHYDMLLAAIDDSYEDINFPTIESIKDIENYLKDKGLSSSQRKILISKIKEFSTDNRDDCGEKANEQSDERDVQSELEEKLEKHLVNQKLNALVKIANKYRS